VEENVKHAIETKEDLHRFGIEFADECPHAFDPKEWTWNESWFWDWCDATGKVAGHFRIGLHPTQGRIWLWFHLFNDGEWIIIEEPYLPYAELQFPRFVFQKNRLRFSYDVIDPLKKGRVQFEGFGRVMTGQRTGRILPAAIDLAIDAAGIPYCWGRRKLEKPDACQDDFQYESARYEQPTDVQGKIHFGSEEIAFSGRGERDHSWGPRHGVYQLNFLAAHSSEQRLQCLAVPLGDDKFWSNGYMRHDTTEPIREARFQFTYDHTSLLHPVSGRLEVIAGNEKQSAYDVESLTATSIDASHTCEPPDSPAIWRVLVRLTPADGGEVMLGWFDYMVF